VQACRAESIGLVTLVGLITKRSIPIVEFANPLQERGRDQASGDRGFRPAAAADPDDHFFFRDSTSGGNGRAAEASKVIAIAMNDLRAETELVTASAWAAGCPRGAKGSGFWFAW